MQRQLAIASAGAAAFLLSFSAGAHPFTAQECAEGSDFIKNAALSRENGVNGMEFMTRAIADLAAIKSFPPQLRWFVQDQPDEDFLLAALAEVFSAPQDPRLHQSNFFGACSLRMSLSE
ncbi:MAG: hypothetical protein JWN94_748 [Betaproteobacteria bacterium]|nr:hypothetical protein [Betaproteobacteria bacterium]